MAKQICSKQDIQKTATGFVSDSLCSVAGVSIASHSEINGDFNSAYTVTTTSHSDLGNKGAPRDTVTKIEAKWLGACKPDQKPGDIVMPGGGFKLNVKDMDKLKAWLAKGAQPSDRVMRFLDAAGVKKREKRNNPEKAVPRKERKAAAEAAAKK